MNKETGTVRKYSLEVREIEPRKLTKQQKKDFKEASKILNESVKKPIRNSLKENYPTPWLW